MTVDEAVACLQNGKLISYPTEAVYGLGCDPGNERSVRQLLSLKQRPASAGLILIADDFERFRAFIKPLCEELEMRARSAWPGPVTWLVPRAENVPSWLAGDHETIALRVTDHPVCIALCASWGGPIVSTSANPRHAEPARSPARVGAYFGDALCGIVAGELGDSDSPSEIRDLVSDQVLREG
ncbi:L-threonylcarbamoyladenylate synthase [Pseudomonadota bacterium]